MTIALLDRVFKCWHCVMTIALLDDVFKCWHCFMIVYLLDHVFNALKQIPKTKLIVRSSRRLSSWNTRYNIKIFWHDYPPNSTSLFISEILVIQQPTNFLSSIFGSDDPSEIYLNRKGAIIGLIFLAVVQKNVGYSLPIIN